MSLFSGYQDLPNSDPSNQLEQPVTDNKWLRKIHKQLKRQNKLLEEIRDSLAVAKASGSQITASTKTDAEGKKERSFLKKLGDAIVKAVPAVLSAIANSAVKFIVKGAAVMRTRTSKSVAA